MNRALTAVCALAAAALLRAQQPPPAPNVVTIDDVIDRESADAFALAPDGGRAAYVKHVPDKKKNEMKGTIWMVDLASGKARALTAGKTAESKPRWAPDGRRLAFLAARPSDEDGEATKPRRPAGSQRKADPEEPKEQVFVLSMEGGEAVKITSFDEGVEDFSWAASDAIVVAARERLARDEKREKDEKDESEPIEDLARWRLQAVRLFLVTLEGAEPKKTTRLTENEDHVESVVVSPDGELAVAVHQRTPLFQVDAKVPPRIVVWNTKTGSGREIFGDRKSRPRSFFWSGDGRMLFATGNRPTIDGEDTAGITVAYAIDRDTLTPAEIDLGWPNGLTDGNLAVRDGGFLARLAAGTRPKPAHIRRTESGFERVVLEGEAAQEVREIIARPGVARVIYGTSTASDPGGWHVGRIEGSRLVQERELSVAATPLEDKDLAKTEVIRFEGAGRDEVEAILFRPLHHRDGERHPLILMTHGGPHGADYDMLMDDWAYAPNLYTARGAYVLSVNYHGSSDYGLKFSESIRGRYFELELIDLCKGIEFVSRREPIDHDRLGLIGWSNGAILSIAMLTLVNEFAPGFDYKFRVCVAGAGDVNFVSDYGPCEFGVEFDDYYLGGPPWKLRDVYLRKSALFHAESVTTPTIIFFGTEDRKVPTGQGWEWYRALQQVGKAEVKFFLFPGEEHGLKKLSHQRRKLEEELLFVEKHLFGTRRRMIVEEGSPLWAASQGQTPARTGGFLGVGFTLAATSRPDSGPTAKLLIPEVVSTGALRIGRFEVTRAQWKSFAPEFDISDGCGDLPISGVSFEHASGYVAWLSKVTGRPFRLPTHDELTELIEEAGPEENTLDWWMGGKPSALEVKDFRRDFESLGLSRKCQDAPPLILPAGSRPPAAVGPRGSKVAVYDLGGNVAEWATPDKPKATDSRAATQPATPRAIGGCAWLPSDPGTTKPIPPAAYVGLRVVES